MSSGGKGSSPRPYSVDQKTFGDNWDRIFSKKTPTFRDLEEDADERARLAELGLPKPTPDYEPDDGPLTEDQLRQIKESVNSERTLDGKI